MRSAGVVAVISVSFNPVAAEVAAFTPVRASIAVVIVMIVIVVTPPHQPLTVPGLRARGAAVSYVASQFVCFVTTPAVFSYGVDQFPFPLATPTVMKVAFITVIVRISKNRDKWKSYKVEGGEIMTRKRKPKVAGDEISRPSKAAETFARAKRRADVAELYLRGHSQALVAEKLGVSPTTVTSDLKKIMDEWLKDAALAFEERKAKELAKIDHIEVLAYRGWEKSIEKQEVHRSHKETVRQAVRNSDNKVTGHRMVPVKVIDEVVVKGQSGDPRFLEMIGRCVEMRMRILGLWKGDQGKMEGTVLIDWTQLFRAQAEEAARTADDQRAKELGYHTLPPKPIVEVEARNGERGAKGGGEPHERDHEAGVVPPGGSDGGAGERNPQEEARGRARPGTNERNTRPVDFPPEDPIEARLRAEELSMGIKLPEEPT